MIRSMVVTYYEVKNWTLDLRTTRVLPLLTGYPPACPNAYRYPRAVEVVSSLHLNHR